jgi:outer membrane receptor for ferric coprogen and ferric-rhodotorulic acid
MSLASAAMLASCWLASPATAQDDPARPHGSGHVEEPTAVGEIIVTGLRRTTTVAKQGVEIRDLPQAITIVPKQVLDEAAARRYEDIA